MNLHKNHTRPVSNYNADFYPFRVWAWTIFLSPVLPVLAGQIISPQNSASGVFVIATLVIYGLTFSLPFLCIYWLAYDFMVKRHFKSHVVRLILALIFIGFISFILSGFDFFDEESVPWSFLFVALSYIVVNVAAAWLLKFSSERIR